MRIKKPAGHHEATFTFPVLCDYRVFVVFTEDIGASVDYLADRDNFNLISSDNRLVDCVACHLHPEGRGHSYIVFNPTARAGSIAHECWHMINNLMEFTGVKLDDEFVAYHLGHAVQQVVEFQYVVQGRTKNVDSGRISPKAGTGRVGRSRGHSSKPQSKGGHGIYGSSKVRRSKACTR